MPRVIASLLLALVLGYSAIGLLMWITQDRLIYFPEAALATTPQAVRFDYDDLTLTAEDGVRLHGWFVPAPRTAPVRGVLLFLHGNGGNISHRLDKIAIFRGLGLDVLIIDYRGYGRSDGKPDEAGTYRDARAAWRYLTDTRGVSPGHIVIYGESLGGAVAAGLAAELGAGQAPRALIVDSVFTSVPDLGAELYPWLPVRLLSRYRYDTRAALARVQAPVLVIHSRNDEIIPFAHGERLFAAAGQPKRLLEIRGDHNAGFLISGAQYIEGIGAFLRANEKASTGRD